MANRYYCQITDRFYTQAQIDARLSNMYRGKHEGGSYFICEGCGLKAHDNSHTISQKRCKHLHKVCLIWDEDNLKDLCRTCHLAFEIGGPEAEKLFCYDDCMEYIKIHDPEGYNKRIYLK